MRIVNGYIKPDLTNLPGEVGRSIIESLMNAEIPDDGDLWEDVKVLDAQIKKDWERNE